MKPNSTLPPHQSLPQSRPRQAAISPADRRRTASILHPPFSILAATATLALLLAAPAHALLPQAACVFYGQARDEGGVPYTGNAEVILRLGGTEVTRYQIRGALAPGINFRLMLPLDDGRGSAYARYAARPGDPVQILLRTSEGERPLAATQALAAAGPGELVSVYVSTGTDSDHDGLPDRWEWELIANSDGALTNLAAVRPEDDFDGDGASNGDEYRAGTYAFLAGDFLAVEEMTVMDAGLVRLRFLTSPGITYQVEGAGELGPEVAWEPVPFAFAPDTAPAGQALLGDGFYVDVYVAASATIRFFRLSAR